MLNEELRHLHVEEQQIVTLILKSKSYAMQLSTEQHLNLNYRCYILLVKFLLERFFDKI